LIFAQSVIQLAHADPQLVCRGGAIAVVLDSVRYPKGFLMSLPNQVITLDAPADGCTFMWTPIRAELFKPRPWKEREGIICPVRLRNYPMREKAVGELQKMGVKIIERDDEKRSYQDYVDDLCSARGVINFCQDRKTGKPQVKGRVFEALAAGALLFEEDNPNTVNALPLGSFLPWHNTDELKMLTNGFSEEVCEKIAHNGQEAADFFNSERFWAVVEKFAE